MTMLLMQTCTISRATEGAKRLGFSESDVWAEISKDVLCRIDFFFRNRSRPDQVTEEHVGRTSAILFVLSDVDIKARDIIIINDAAGESIYAGKQYDVEYADPTIDSIGVHHLECSVTVRDNVKKDITALP